MSLVVQADALQQIGRIDGRSGDARRFTLQRAQQQKLAVVVADIHGAEHGVGIQHLGQYRQELQALLLILRCTQRAMRQYPYDVLGGADKAPRPFIDHPCQLPRRIVRSGHQCATASAIPLHQDNREHGQYAENNGRGDQPLDR